MINMLYLFAAIMCLVQVTIATPDKIRIASFNVENYGASKSEKLHALNTLAQIVCRYDIISILEVKD